MPTNSISNISTSTVENVTTVRIFVILVTSRTIQNVKMHRTRLEFVYVFVTDRIHTCSLFSFRGELLNEAITPERVSTLLLHGIHRSLQKNVGIIAGGALCMFMLVCKYIFLHQRRGKYREF
jgi:hypothetical protein